MAKPRLALVFGGQSPEHGVSCLSAASIFSALDKEAFDVVAVGITKRGNWRVVPGQTISKYRIEDGQVPEVSESGKDAFLARFDQACVLAERNQDAIVNALEIDVAFSVIHGQSGEDGAIQGMFEIMGIPYVGAGIAASAIGLDKHFMKVVFDAAGIPIGPYVAFSAHEWQHQAAAVRESINQLHYPLFVKPARGGSSLGISLVEDPADLDKAIAHAQTIDPKVVVEQGFMNAREVECAVLAAPDTPAGCVTSLPGEISVSGARFYDFEAKYVAGDQAELDDTAALSDELRERVRELASQVFAALGIEGLARVDTFITEDGQVFVNEVNTMPGFTQISMYSRMWAASGLAYEQLLNQLINLALTRPVGLR